MLLCSARVPYQQPLVPLFCRFVCFGLIRVWRRLTPLSCDVGDAACMH